MDEGCCGICGGGESRTVLDPFERFQGLYQSAASGKLSTADSMILVTADASCNASGRVVLLRGIVPPVGFRFYTNYMSRKAKDLRENPKAQLLFYWPEIGAQIRAYGSVERSSVQISDQYWNERPRESQIGAWASDQSAPLDSLNDLKERFNAISKQYEGRNIPRPEHWGGYDFSVSQFEFWSEREYRLHERLIYTRNGNQWIESRIFP